MTGRSITAVVVGVVVALVGGVLISGAVGPLTENRDSDGFYMSDPLTVDRPSRAIVTGDSGMLRGRYETVVESSVVLAFVADPADVRMQGFSLGAGPLFMGIAATSAVEEYLDEVAHDEITSWDLDLAAIRDVEYTTHQGTGTPSAPSDETFWVTSVEGAGLRTLDWTIEPGDWTALIMNADASNGVTAELTLGAAPSNVVYAIAWSSLALGLIALIGGGFMVFYGLRRRDRDSTSFSMPDEQSTPETVAGPS